MTAGVGNPPAALTNVCEFMQIHMKPELTEFGEKNKMSDLLNRSTGPHDNEFNLSFIPNLSKPPGGVQTVTFLLQCVEIILYFP